MKAKNSGPSPGQPGPGPGKDKGDNGNNGPSKPKDPNNDPDQTPTREIQDPPQADPGTKEAPGRENPSKPDYK